MVTFVASSWKHILCIESKVRCCRICLEEEYLCFPADAVVVILWHIYGLHDAPQRWWNTVDNVMVAIGSVRSMFDVPVCVLCS